MDQGHALANLPSPLAIVLTAAGVGSGGVGAWSMLAARAASHPVVQQAMVDASLSASHTINSGLQAAVQWQHGSAALSWGPLLVGGQLCHLCLGRRWRMARSVMGSPFAHSLSTRQLFSAAGAAIYAMYG